LVAVVVVAAAGSRVVITSSSCSAAIQHQPNHAVFRQVYKRNEKEKHPKAHSLSTVNSDKKRAHKNTKSRTHIHTQTPTHCSTEYSSCLRQVYQYLNKHINIHKIWKFG
jgi:hypothetical protein